MPFFGEPNLANDENTMVNPFALDQANGDYQDTGIFVDLPRRGSYMLYANVKGRLQSASGSGHLTAKLRNTTDGIDISNSERLIGYAGAINQENQATAVITAKVAVNGPKRIALFAKRDGAISWTTSEIHSSVDGKSSIRFVKIGPG